MRNLPFTAPFPLLSSVSFEDFHFLTAFSRAHALTADAAAAAGDSAAAETLAELQESVDEELGLHRGFAASWGVVLKNEDGGDDDSPSSSPSLPRPSAATPAYTRFLLETAGSAASSPSSSSSHSSPLAGVARALAAMAPCCRLYGWLGVKLAREREKAQAVTKNPFAAWIETYSSVEYHAATAKLEGLLDRLAEESLSVEERGEFFSFLLGFDELTFRDESGGGRNDSWHRNSNDALDACCCCLFFEQKQQQQQQHCIAETLRHAPGVCSRRRPRTKGRGKGIGVVVAVAAAG